MWKWIITAFSVCWDVSGALNHEKKQIKNCKVRDKNVVETNEQFGKWIKKIKRRKTSDLNHKLTIRGLTNVKHLKIHEKSIFHLNFVESIFRSSANGHGHGPPRLSLFNAISISNFFFFFTFILRLSLKVLIFNFINHSEDINVGKFNARIEIDTEGKRWMRFCGKVGKFVWFFWKTLKIREILKIFLKKWRKIH